MTDTFPLMMGILLDALRSKAESRLNLKNIHA